MNCNEFCGNALSEVSHHISFSVTFIIHDFLEISCHYKAKEDRITVLQAKAYIFSLENRSIIFHFEENGFSQN